MIKLINVSKIYKTKNRLIKALDLINCVLPNTGFVGLTGENGCGKTTLLNIISTIDNDFVGDVFIDQHNVRDDYKIIRSKKVSYVFQENYFIENLSIIDNLKIVNSDNFKVENLLNEFKLSEKENLFSNTLSGGQKQRASVVRGLLKTYDILLVDEPTSSMNEEMEKYVFEILKQVSNEKLVLLVSHNQSMLYSYCDIVIKLDDGKIENITQNTTCSELKYIDNIIYFNSNINFKAVDNNLALDMLDKHGEIIIRRKSNASNIKQLNYDIKETKYHNEGFMDETSYSIMKKSIYKYFIKTCISFIFILSSLLFIFQCIIDFKAFHSNEFIYNTLVNNEETFVNANVSSLKNDYVELDNSILNIYSNDFDNRIETVSKIENGKSFPFNGDEFYCNIIQTFNISNFKGINIIEGNIPKTYNSFAITDYIADACILKTEDYDTYSDIISKGITIDGYKLSISGIIDTDYENYKQIFYDLKERENINYYYNLSFIYGSIYGIEQAAINENKIGFTYVSNGDFYADIETNILVSDNKCYVNRSFAEYVSYDGTPNFPVKYENGYIYIDKIIEDENLNPTMYINDNMFSQFLHDRFKKFDSINVEISSQKSIDFLINNLITFNCYSGTYMYKIINIIDTLGYLFVGIIIGFIVILVFISLIYLRKIFKNSCRVYVFQKMLGYKERYLFLTEIYSLSFVLLCVSIVNIVMYFGLYVLLNKVLSNLFDTNINMFLHSFYTVFISLIFIFMLVYLLYIILYKVRNKFNIINLIKNA